MPDLTDRQHHILAILDDPANRVRILTSADQAAIRAALSEIDRLTTHKTPLANVVEMGDIAVERSGPCGNGAIDTYPFSILLQFDSPTDLQVALKAKHVEFTLFRRKTEETP